MSDTFPPPSNLPTSLLSAATGLPGPDGLTIPGLQAIIAAADSASIGGQALRDSLGITADTDARAAIGVVCRHRTRAIVTARVAVSRAARHFLSELKSPPSDADMSAIKEARAALGLAAEIAAADGDKASAACFWEIHDKIQETVGLLACLERLYVEPTPQKKDTMMNTQLAAVRAKEAIEVAEENAEQARIEWLAVRGSDEEGPAYKRWQEALHELRFAGA